MPPRQDLWAEPAAEPLRRRARYFADTPRPLEFTDRPATATLAAGVPDREFRYLKASGMKPDVENVPQFRLVTPLDLDYGAVLRSSFAFLRRHANGRYSAGSLMRILSAADRFDEVGASANANLPELVVASLPYTYDEETEVKTGGLVGVNVVFPSDNCRTVIAVHTQRRRQGIGTVLTATMLNGHRYYPLTFWVGQQNFDGQRFLLNLGLYPTLINNQGAVRYGTGQEEAEV